MSRWLGFVCAASLLLLGAKPQSSAKPQNGMFSKYKAVEAYEVRPGILAMPRYTADGGVCEIGVARSAYSPEMIRTGTSLTRKEIDEIAADLAPLSERGPKTPMFGTINENGPDGDETIAEADTYENVNIDIYGYATKYDAGDVAFTIEWTKLKCPRPLPTLSMYR